jgi:beta-glucosidase
LKLGREAFEFFDPTTNTMRVKPGRYQLLYGTSSRAEDLQQIDIQL